MSRRSVKILFSFLLTFLLVAPLAVAQAQGTATPDPYGLDTTAGGAGIPKTGTLQTKIGTVTGAILSLVGIAFFLLTLYGGFLWMTARGDDAQAKKAMGVIIDAGIGLVIVSAAYIITKFVFGAIGQ